MIKLKKLHLQNFCGYKDAKFDFTEEGKIKPLAMLYGPNGCGKSSILEAILTLSSARRFENRDNSMLFRKMTWHPDYEPTYSAFRTGEDSMRMEAVFDTVDGDKRVILEHDPRRVNKKTGLPEEGYEINGVEVNELPLEITQGAYYVDADHPMNLQKFQVLKDAEDVFLDIARAVYGLECRLDKEVEEYDSQTGKYMTFYTDFIIHKPTDRVNVHFKRMSAGEKKIATMLSMICDPYVRKGFGVLLIDNVELHVYYKRHAIMIDKLDEHFADQQIFATTHSPVLIGHDGVPGYVDEKYLYDIEEIKRNVT